MKTEILEQAKQLTNRIEHLTSLLLSVDPQQATYRLHVADRNEWRDVDDGTHRMTGVHIYSKNIKANSTDSLQMQFDEGENVKIGSLFSESGRLLVTTLSKNYRDQLVAVLRNEVSLARAEFEAL